MNHSQSIHQTIVIYNSTSGTKATDVTCLDISNILKGAEADFKLHNIILLSNPPLSKRQVFYLYSKNTHEHHERSSTSPVCPEYSLNGFGLNSNSAATSNNTELHCWE